MQIVLCGHFLLISSTLLSSTVSLSHTWMTKVFLQILPCLQMSVTKDVKMSSLIGLVRSFLLRHSLCQPTRLCSTSSCFRKVTLSVSKQDNPSLARSGGYIRGSLWADGMWNKMLQLTPCIKPWASGFQLTDRDRPVWDCLRPGSGRESPLDQGRLTWRNDVPERWLKQICLNPVHQHWFSSQNAAEAAQAQTPDVKSVQIKKTSKSLTMYCSLWSSH